MVTTEVTLPERPRGVKHEIKRPESAIEISLHGFVKNTHQVLLVTWSVGVGSAVMIREAPSALILMQT